MTTYSLAGASLSLHVSSDYNSSIQPNHHNSPFGDGMVTVWSTMICVMAIILLVIIWIIVLKMALIIILESNQALTHPIHSYL